jgi:large subunit ribosomal protein L24
VDIRKGDTVIVISGDERGNIGRVLAVFPKKQRVLVEKINMIKRHTRGRSQTQMQGGIIEKEAPLHVSNVALYDPKQKVATRVKYRIRYETDAGRRVAIKERLSVRTGEVIEGSGSSKNA